MLHSQRNVNLHENPQSSRRSLNFRVQCSTISSLLSPTWYTESQLGLTRHKLLLCAYRLHIVAPSGWNKRLKNPLSAIASMILRAGKTNSDCLHDPPFTQRIHHWQLKNSNNRYTSFKRHGAQERINIRDTATRTCNLPSSRTIVLG